MIQALAMIVGLWSAFAVPLVLSALELRVLAGSHDETGGEFPEPLNTVGVRPDGRDVPDVADWEARAAATTPTRVTRALRGVAKILRTS